METVLDGAAVVDLVGAIGINDTVGRAVVGDEDGFDTDALPEPQPQLFAIGVKPQLQQQNPPVFTNKTNRIIIIVC